MKTFLTIIGFAGFGVGVIEAIRSDNEGKLGWALIWRGQMFLGASLIAAMLT